MTKQSKGTIKKKQKKIPDEKIIGHIMDNIIEAADIDRLKDNDYQDLVKSKDIYELISIADDKMTNIALSVSQILKQKYKVEIKNEVWSVIVGLAKHLSEQEQFIARSEGRTCCVDKAHARTVNYIKSFIK